MSTRAKREGHAWIQGEMNKRHYDHDEWLITKRGTFANGYHSIVYEQNLEVWVRFYEFNHLRYHHIWLLGKIETGEWHIADLKRTWRLILDRIKVCKKPRLP